MIGAEEAKGCAFPGLLPSGTTVGSASPVPTSDVDTSLHWPEPWELNSQLREATEQLRQEIREEIRVELAAVQGRSAQMVAAERREREQICSDVLQELRQGLQHQQKQGELCAQSVQALQQTQAASGARFREVAEKAAIEECAKKQGVINEIKHDLDSRLKALGARLDKEISTGTFVERHELQRMLEELECTLTGERKAQASDIAAIWERIEALQMVTSPKATGMQALAVPMEDIQLQLTQMQDQMLLNVEGLYALRVTVDGMALKVEGLRDGLRGVEQKQELTSESLVAQNIGISKIDRKLDEVDRRLDGVDQKIGGEDQKVREDLRSIEERHEETSECLIAQMAELWDHSSKVVQQLSEIAARLVTAGVPAGTSATRTPTPVRSRPTLPRSPAS